MATGDHNLFDFLTHKQILSQKSLLQPDILTNMLKSLAVSTEHTKIDRQQAHEVIRTALEARSEHRGGVFAQDIEPPEKPFIELLKKHSVAIGEPHLPLNAIFLITPFVFGDDTGRFFRRISDPVSLAEYAWLFQPEEVVRRANSGINVEAECSKFFRLAGYNKNALAQYVHNCRLITERFNGNVGNFFSSEDNDATRIIKALVVYPRAKTEEKPEFRRYGPKLARLLIQWVNQYNLYPLKNADRVGLPIDFQVARILIQTGALQLESPVQAHFLTYKVILPLLTEICAETGWNPQVVSETLWLMGYWGCNRKRHNICPVETICGRLISRRPYDKDGLFDPTDTGRFKPKRR